MYRDRRNYHYHTKKRRRSTGIPPFAVIALTVILCFFCWSLYRNAHNNADDSKAELIHYQTQQIALKKKLATVKPQINSVQDGGFHLQAKEKKLNEAYNGLLRFAFGTARSLKEIQAKKYLYEKYFGKDGYATICRYTFPKINHGNRRLALKNEKVQVGFSNFNLDSQTITVTFYTAYVTENKKVKDMVYGSTDYSFADHQALTAKLMQTQLGDN